MPELPEVQTVVNDLRAAGLVGATITRAQVFWPRIIDSLSVAEFCQRLTGQTVRCIWRRAKYIVFDFERGSHLLIHLRMSGRLHFESPDAPRQKHEHVLLDVADGRQLRFHDTRKFGRLYFVTTLDSVVGKLGPEPLAAAFTARILAARLRAHRRQLKPALLDQTVLAGLGNIYVDEALWRARLHPGRNAASLTDGEIRALHRAIRQALRHGIANFGTTLGHGKANFYSLSRQQGQNRTALNVFQRTGLPCPRCHQPITRLIIGQRSTHICPKCQLEAESVRSHKC